MAELCGGGNCSRNCVRYIVELQVEEDFITEARQPLNCSRAFGGIKLAADLE